MKADDILHRIILKQHKVVMPHTLRFIFVFEVVAHCFKHIRVDLFLILEEMDVVK
jgi:hypothetical protein